MCIVVNVNSLAMAPVPQWQMRIVNCNGSHPVDERRCRLAVLPRFDRGADDVKYVSFLLSTGFNDRQHRFDEPTS